ncbi:MAG: DUF3604 domain-containing protein, partial [Pseudomonadales bacterium]
MNSVLIRNATASVFVVLFVLAWSQILCAKEADGKPANSAIADDVRFRKRPLFGDLHIHTQYSLDSYIMRNKNGPDEAYRFAQGKKIKLAGGKTIQLATPLDFAAVTDHSEWFGELALLEDPKQPYFGHPDAVGIRQNNPDTTQIHQNFAKFASTNSPTRPPIAGIDRRVALGAVVDVWQIMKDAAERHYVPGQFTTLLGFEWSAMPDGHMLHR